MTAHCLLKHIRTSLSSIGDDVKLVRLSAGLYHKFGLYIVNRPDAQEVEP